METALNFFSESGRYSGFFVGHSSPEGFVSFQD